MEFDAEKGRLPPGIRFHPTDEELVMHYLKRKMLGKRLEPELVAEVEIYKFHPADLKEKACLNKDLNWYFFCPRGKKYCIGDRTNRATESGYWKATGKDRDVLYRDRTVGKVKTLVFHMGKPPKGVRTDWVMHEYRLEDAELANCVVQDAYVLCKIFKKSGWGPRSTEQYGAPYIEEEWNDNNITNDVVTEDQNASGVTNPAITMDSSSPTEIFSCDVLVDQAPSMSKPGAMTMDSFSPDLSVSVVDQASTPLSKTDAANIASTSNASDTTPNSDLPIPVQNNTAATWCADDTGDIFDGLGDIPIDVENLWPLSDSRETSDTFDFDETYNELIKELGF